MGGRSKQTACFACVDAKRGCDKARPSCSRCLDKEIDCIYRPQRQGRRPSGLPSLNTGPNIFTWTCDYIDNNIVAAQDALDTSPPAVSSSSTGLAPAPSSPTAVNSSSTIQDGRSAEDISWFLTSSAWTIAYHYQPPASLPSARILTDFVRGLQGWLVRFVREGHNPFIHRHLYSDHLPKCMQDAYSAIVIEQTLTTDNEHMVETISSSHISDLLACQPPGSQLSIPLLSTREHLARTQALLIHLLIALFSSSVSRRSNAESHLEVLLQWRSQLWESAALDATMSPPFPELRLRTVNDEVDPSTSVSNLYRAFVLSESIRRTWLLSNFVTGIFQSLKAAWSSCSGDIYMTANAELWKAPSSATWEAIARRSDPLFVQSLRGKSQIARDAGAATEIDEFAQHLFTVM